MINWEYGGMSDPYFDLGDFVTEHPFARDRSGSSSRPTAAT